MKIIRPVNITTSGSFSRASNGTYFDSAGALQTASVNIPRLNYDPITLEFKGVLLEAYTRNWAQIPTNVWTGTKFLSQAAGTYTLSFYGSGTITMSGGATATVVGLGAFPQRKTYTFTKTASDVTFTITGTVQYVQIEDGSVATSYVEKLFPYDTGIREPDVITGSGVIYSNITENDYGEWEPSTSYSVGNRVIRLTTHRIYENLIAGVNATLPENDTSGRWLDIGPTNLFAAFDESMASVATATNEIVYILKPGKVGSIALLGMNATSVEIATSTYSTGELVYSASADLLTGATIGSWYQYFYEPIYKKDALVVTDLLDAALLNLPLYSDCVITVRVKYPSTQVTLGALVVGLSADIGMTQYDTSIGIIDYSSINTDTFGRKSIVRRGFSKRVNVDLLVKNEQVDTVARLLQLYRATPLVWVGTDNVYNSLVVYGPYKDWEISYTQPAHSRLTLQIEGLSQ